VTHTCDAMLMLYAYAMRMRCCVHHVYACYA
jgi:hypothetical protein